MTKAEEFSKDMRNVLKRKLAVQDDLTKIRNKWPIYKSKDLFATVTAHGNLEVSCYKISDGLIPKCDPETALKLAQWIQDVFGSDSTETRTHEYKPKFKDMSYTAEETRLKEADESLRPESKQYGGIPH